MIIPWLKIQELERFLIPMLSVTTYSEKGSLHRTLLPHLIGLPLVLPMIIGYIFVLYEFMCCEVISFVAGFSIFF
jgi:hypothetical protein